MTLRTLPRTLAAVAGLAALVYATTGSDDDAAAASSRFERIKALAGDWVALDEDGERGERITVSRRVTAGGSAVLEILFPGTEHEMVTVYHQDGDDLVLTHYCVLGNQPRMRARGDTGPGKIVFECQGGTNMVCEDDKHMHQGTFTWIEDDRIQSEWLQFENGQNVYTASFELVRTSK